jgi:hypothetical protein
VSLNLPKSASNAKFDDPFLLPSSDTFPTDIKSSLDLCLYLYRINPLYGAVTSRVVSYFLTELDFDGSGDENERKELKGMLTNVVGLFSKLAQAGVEWAIYGNSFIRCSRPFDRYLVDTRNGYRLVALSSYDMDEVRYDWQKMQYEVPDLSAAAKMPASSKAKGGAKGKKKRREGVPRVWLDFEDLPSAAPDRFDVTFLDPRYVTLDKAHFSDATQYIYTIPPEVIGRVKSNQHHEIVNMSKGILRAISQDCDYRYHTGEVFHFRAPTPTGVSDSGWGFPNILWHYDSLYQIQVYRKADQAVALDMMTPFTLISPELSSTPTGPAQQLVLAQFRGQVEAMIANRRKDKFAIHSLPFPVNFQQLGGNGKQFALHELVTIHSDALFDGLGYPQELFRGSLNIEQVPTALKLFERTYEWLYQCVLGAAKFIAAKVQDAMDLSALDVTIKRPALAHSVEARQLLMQLAANGEIPREVVYGELGIPDVVEAVRKRILEEQGIQRVTAEMGAKFEKEKTTGSMADITMMSAEQGAGGAPPGPSGAPAPGGGGSATGGSPDYSVDPNADPMNIQERAQSIAQTWLEMHQQQPNSHKREMAKCEATNPTLHAAAKQAMEKMRSQAGSAGRANVLDMIGPPQ